MDAPGATVEPFDPLGDLFVAQFAKPAQLGSVNLRALTRFHRALLVIDGTVTKFIEAYTLEPVETIRIGQERRRLSADQPWLEAAKGIEVLVRSAYLKGKYSDTIHAYAMSLVVPDRLPEPVRELLEDEGGSLGRILLDHRLETRRDVLWYGREPLQDLPDPIRHLVGGEVISRTYRIILGGQPVMLINEKFPSGPDPLPSHD